MVALISDIKSKNEDFEFYPTTNEIIQALTRDLKSIEGYGYHRFTFSSFLDIGAGNGKVLTAVEKACAVKVYAIEKSATLRDLLNQSVYIIGTDFLEQSLLDKTMDVTFCNPPYSAYEEWTKKIIRETCSRFVYLVIPKRWIESREIKEALKYRDAKYKTIGEFSFVDAEDRSARAVVNLVKIELSNEKDDAFDRLFDEEFKGLNKSFSSESAEDEEDEQPEKKGKFTGLILGKDYVKNLVYMYNADIKNIKNNYDLVGKLDANLLKEFDITPTKIRTCLKERLKNLKNLYWNELTSRMTEITERLISKKRRKLLDTLQANGHVDFTESNVYAVVLWILKNAGQHIDDQIIDVYEDAISKANCRNYKSNARVFQYDRWRYNEEKPTHIFLEYRIVLESCGGFDNYSYRGYRLDERACEYLSDILTIANNLGFKRVRDIADDRLYQWGNESVWSPGKPQLFECYYEGKKETLIEVRVHKNRNIHVRMNQKFALALNVEYGRLKGWIHSGEQAAEELSDKEAGQYFKSNFALLGSSSFFMIEDQSKKESVLEAIEITEECEQVTLF